VLGISPLFSACGNGDIDAIAALVQYDADINSQSCDGSNLIFAALNHADAVLALANAINLKNDKMRANGNDLAPCPVASLSTKTRGVQEMINSANRDNIVPIQEVMKRTWGHTSSVLNALIKCGADSNFKDIDGTTPLCRVSQLGDVEAIRCLVENSAQVNVQNSSGISPILRATESGNPTAVRILAEFKADVNIVNKKGIAPY
jgi:ankyrin repeat protein